MKILNVFEKRQKPIDFLPKDLFSLGVINPVTIYASRKAYKTQKSLRDTRIRELSEKFAIKNNSINFLDIGARGGANFSKRV